MYTTRIAPSPTGDMHLGTARTAYFNWLAARATGGKFILRIDDTDADRNDDSKVDVILNTMDWLGLDYDAVHRQSDRLDFYRNIADWLTDRSLTKIADNGAILLNWKATEMGVSTWHDTIAGDQSYTPNICKSLDRDIVLIRGNGMPTYHFASVVDDNDMGVNRVIRGSDHFNNTFLHHMITYAIDGIRPRYTHLGLITKDKKKMSKRDGAASMLAYRDSGYDPDAMLDYMLRLGWGPAGGNDHKVITRDMALDMFLDGNLKASPAGFDPVKLDSLDRKHKGRKRS